jgi:hypothetical protein
MQWNLKCISLKMLKSYTIKLTQSTIFKTSASITVGVKFQMKCKYHVHHLERTEDIKSFVYKKVHARVFL